MMSVQDKIEEFFKSPKFGVVGASSKRYKYGNKVLRCYLQNDREAIPVNPNEKEIEGLPAVGSVADLPAEVQSISVITPPEVTEKVVEEAARRGIMNIWMQPGAESDAAVGSAEKKGLNVIADGSCLLVVLGYREE